MKILVFGDSIGYGKRDHEGGWVARLRKRVDETYNLGEQCFNAQVYNCCIPGETALRLQQRFQQELAMRVVDVREDVRVIVIFAIGINDSCLKPWIQEKQTSTQDFQKAMCTIIEYCTNKKYEVIVVGLTPVDESKIGALFQNSVIQQYNVVLENCAKQYLAEYIPLYELFFDKGLIRLMGDGIHPDEQGHECIFQEVRGRIGGVR